MPKMSFEVWKERLDNILANILGGLISDDLPDDVDYHSWWDAGMMPSEAVDNILKRHYDGLL